MADTEFVYWVDGVRFTQPINPRVLPAGLKILEGNEPYPLHIRHDTDKRAKIEQ